MSEEFYIGYLPKAPLMLARWLRRVSAALAAVGGIVAATLVFAQQPFAGSAFEYGKVQSFEGILWEAPFPRLGPYMLAGAGKHGVQEMFRGHDGRRAKVNGSLIHREGLRMVEVESSRLSFEAPSGARRAVEELGEVKLRGEIVDAKCYLGVMNPGSGQVHRDCAARCLSGGLPAMFIADGKKMLLEGLNIKKNLDRVGVPIELKGKLRKDEEWLVLRVTGL